MGPGLESETHTAWFPARELAGASLSQPLPLIFSFLQISVPLKSQINNNIPITCISTAPPPHHYQKRKKVFDYRYSHSQQIKKS